MDSHISTIIYRVNRFNRIKAPKILAIVLLQFVLCIVHKFTLYFPFVYHFRVSNKFFNCSHSVLGHLESEFAI